MATVVPMNVLRTLPTFLLLVILVNSTPAVAEGEPEPSGDPEPQSATGGDPQGSSTSASQIGALPAPSEADPEGCRFSILAVVTHAGQLLECIRNGRPVCFFVPYGDAPQEFCDPDAVCVDFDRTHEIDLPGKPNYSAAPDVSFSWKVPAFGVDEYGSAGFGYLQVDVGDAATGNCDNHDVATVVDVILYSY